MRQREIVAALLIFIALIFVFNFRNSKKSETNSQIQTAQTPVQAPEINHNVLTKNHDATKNIVKETLVKSETKIIAFEPPAKQAPPQEAAKPPVPSVELHPELIPKEIKIVRLYFSNKLVAPGNTIGFDINGSGFNDEFQKMISVDPGADNLKVSNLKLITANQIHGDIDIGPEAKTAFVYPKILINGTPVYLENEPFGVIRLGEVLTIERAGVSEDGHSTGFRVLTNINENMFRQFWVQTDRPGPVVSELTPAGHFTLEGTLNVGTALPGKYGLTVSIFSKPVYHQEGFDIAAPNVGKNGLVGHLEATDIFHRPSDTVDLLISGAGFAKEDTQLMTGQVIGYDMGPGTFQFVSPNIIMVSFTIPKESPDKSYGVKVSNLEGKLLVQNKNAFKIVPAQWVREITVKPKAIVGQKSTLQLTGRDFTPEFAQELRAQCDNPALLISPFHLTDPSTLEADISISQNVSPGDYLIELLYQNRQLTAQSGNVIKITAQ